MDQTEARAAEGSDGSQGWTIHSNCQTWLLRYAAVHRGLLVSLQEPRVYSWTVLVIRQLEAMLLLLTHWPLMKHALASQRQRAREFRRPCDTLCRDTLCCASADCIQGRSQTLTTMSTSASFLKNPHKIFLSEFCLKQLFLFFT